jgi:Double zinc ribbon
LGEDEKRSEEVTRACPYCKEEIHPEATRCKHCGSWLKSESGPTHGGTCPYCKESIQPDAILCKHCRSPLVSRSEQDSGGCGCGCEKGGDTSGALRAFRGMSEWPSPQLGGAWAGSGGAVTYTASKVCGDCSENLRLNWLGNASGTRTCRIRVCARDPYGGLICTDLPPFKENCTLDIQYL